MALTKIEKQQIIKEFARDEKDTGSTEVQISIFSKQFPTAVHRFPMGCAYRSKANRQ